MTTDSIAATAETNDADFIERITIAPLIAEAMKRVNAETSVSSLFD